MSVCLICLHSSSFIFLRATHEKRRAHRNQGRTHVSSAVLYGVSVANKDDQCCKSSMAPRRKATAMPSLCTDKSKSISSCDAMVLTCSKPQHVWLILLHAIRASVPLSFYAFAPPPATLFKRTVFVCRYHTAILSEAARYRLRLPAPAGKV